MRKYLSASKIHLLILLFLGSSTLALPAEESNNQTYKYNGTFIHPGMAQSKADLEYMCKQIEEGVEPWKSAFNRLKEEVDKPFHFNAYTYVSVGAYGANSVGGKDFSESSRMSYKYALMWYITRDKKYADKSIEILNAWSSRLWAFDANNAKLNVGLFGYHFLNAAEILQHTNSGWEENDITQFKRMLLTVFYPTIKDFFTEANGNWDASMISTMMCMGIFLEDKTMFSRAVERYYRGEGNSGITKYIYQGGQCQETTRDWGHVQLGLGEFSKAAQTAWTQGVDFYSTAEDRLASGFEYAAKFLLGNEIEVFGILSHREMEDKADIYESIYNHYKNERNIKLPYTKTIIEERTREKTSIGFLSATRANNKPDTNLQTFSTEQYVKPSITGALKGKYSQPLSNAVYITPKDSIQQILDKYKGQNKQIVLQKGVYTIYQSLVIPSGITLSGEGSETILHLDPTAEEIAIMVNADKDLHDVCIKDLLIEGGQDTAPAFDPNYERGRRMYNTAGRAGVLFLADFADQMKNITFENVTIQNFTKNGMKIAGASNLIISRCDFNDNGSSVVPGTGFHHNLNIIYSSGLMISESRFTSSLWGHGIAISSSKNINISKSEIARNRLSGLYFSDSKNVVVSNNLIEGNDADGIESDLLLDGCEDILIENNKIFNNTRNDINAKLAIRLTQSNNHISDNVTCSQSAE